MSTRARTGWDSTFREFSAVKRSEILASLCDAHPDSSSQEVSSWHRNLPDLQREVGKVVEIRTDSGAYTAVMEYELPMESRRGDVLLLLLDGVVVVEEGQGPAFRRRCRPDSCLRP